MPICQCCERTVDSVVQDWRDVGGGCMSKHYVCVSCQRINDKAFFFIASIRDRDQKIEAFHLIMKGMSLNAIADLHRQG